MEVGERMTEDEGDEGLGDGGEDEGIPFPIYISSLSIPFYSSSYPRRREEGDGRLDEGVMGDDDNCRSIGQSFGSERRQQKSQVM